MFMSSDRLGEVFAILSVVAFAFGGVAIAKARKTGSSDGGALLSVVLTAILSGLVWLATDERRGSPAMDRSGVTGLAWFAVSGLLSTAAGRALYFRSVQDLGAIRASAVKRAIPLFSVIFGVSLLREPLTTSKMIGVGLIATSIVALGSIDLRAPRGSSREPVNPLGYIWGTVSGISYAASYVARKLGLNLVPDGALGTFVGALAAMSYYVAAASLHQRSRVNSISALTARNGWAIVAALGFSLGQIANFYAIQWTAVSTVGAIQALEVFVSMLVAALILRTERLPSLFTVAAAGIATLGVLLMLVD